MIYTSIFSDYTATLYVPYKSLEKYKNTSYWRNFENILPLDATYLGVVGFNGNMTEQELDVFDEDNVNSYTDKVNSMTTDRYALLYYTAETAIEKMAQSEYVAPLSTAAVITFTDGLDQGSLAMNASIATDRAYAEYLADKIATTKVQDVNITAYTIGLQGDDVMDSGLFSTNLNALASKPENVHQISDINGIDDKFDAIYQDLERQRRQRILKIAVPVMSDGTICRFTLDGATDAESSKVWVEGTFNRGAMRLENLKYQGFNSEDAAGITGAMDGLNIVFTIRNCRDMDGGILEVTKSGVGQWTYIMSTDKWQRNNDLAASDIEVEMRSTMAVMLLLDCSSSMSDSQFAKMKTAANTFIERLIGYEGQYNGVDDITVDGNAGAEVDWSSAEIYNLQGVRVVNPAPGIYIQRAGTHTRKVRL